MGILELIRSESSDSFQLLFLCDEDQQKEIVEMMDKDEKNKF